MGETTDYISNIQRFSEACSLKSNDDDDDHSSSEELPSSKPDEELLHQEDEASSTAEGEQKGGVTLSDKLAQNDAFDVTGVMNFSSMNLSDRDIPMVIQRAFGQKKKKCFGLILRGNALTSEGIRILVDSLLDLRPKLKYLSFADNPDIGDDGIVHLTRLLQTSRSMDFLAVPNTGITDRGVRILADTLCDIDTGSPCAPLEKLYLSFNKLITDESVAAILQIIEKNRTLKLLAIRCCGLSDKVRRRLRQLNTKLKKRKFSLAE